MLLYDTLSEHSVRLQGKKYGVNSYVASLIMPLGNFVFLKEKAEFHSKFGEIILFQI